MEAAMAPPSGPHFTGPIYTINVFNYGGISGYSDIDGYGYGYDNGDGDGEYQAAQVASNYFISS